jgi:hypothetical protein
MLMMKYIRIFLEWLKGLWYDNGHDVLHRKSFHANWVVLLPYVVVVMATLVVVVEAVTDVTDVTPDVPVIPVVSSTTGLDEDQALALDADLCSGRPRQFVLNLDGTQIKLSIQE